MSLQTDCILLYRTPICGCEAGTSLSSKLKVKTVCKIIFFKKIKVRNFINFMVRSERRKSFLYNIVIIKGGFSYLKSWTRITM